MIYYYPNTGRGGLGNKLFPWARAVVYQKQIGGKIVAPNWENYIKIGPYLRKEKDKRHYLNVFNNKGYVRGFKKIVVLKSMEKITESSLSESVNVSNNKNKLIELKNFVGSGVVPYFQALHGYSNVIHEELTRITNKKLHPAEKAENFIGVHIRMGDFSVPKDLDEIRNADALYFRLPHEWYILAITQIRKQLNENLKVILFSDGTPDQLKSILKLPNTELSVGGAAITDLLMLSKANVIVASGSTFSMWAAFLGQKPSIWFTGLRRGNLINNDNHFALQPEWEQGEFPDTFISHIQNSIK